MKKHLEIFIGTFAIVLTVALFIGVLAVVQSPATVQGQVARTTAFAVASSTKFTLTTTSQRLLATTTTPRRVAATIQPINCTTADAVYLSLNRDVAAVAASGLAVHASTTLQLTDYPNLPVVQGAVQGITTGTCTVLVTEWRSQY